MLERLRAAQSESKPVRSNVFVMSGIASRSLSSQYSLPWSRQGVLRTAGSLDCQRELAESRAQGRSQMDPYCKGGAKFSAALRYNELRIVMLRYTMSASSS